MAIAGDFSALKALRERTSPTQMQKLTAICAQRMAGTALKLVADEFRGSVDPYGRPWPPLAWRKGKPLLDTGRMRSATVVAANGPTIQITIGTTYARYHQEGARTRKPKPDRKGRVRKSRARVGRIPQRQMLPDDSTGGLGFIWHRALGRDAQAVVAKALGAAP